VSASELARGCASRASGALLVGARACWQLARSGTATRRTVALRACGSRVSRRSACQRRDRPRRQHARGARARAAAAVVVTNGPCRATTRAARSRATHRLLARKRHAIPSGEDARAAGDAGGRRDGRPRCDLRRTGPATVAGPQPGRRRQSAARRAQATSPERTRGWGRCRTTGGPTPTLALLEGSAAIDAGGAVRRPPSTSRARSGRRATSAPSRPRRRLRTPRPAARAHSPAGVGL
jgi:hypothetical protein